MKKKSLSLLFLSVFVLITVTNIATVSALESPSKLFKTLFFISDDGGFKFSGATAQWYLLALIVILAYASLSSANFPESRGLRWPIALIIGIFATMLITSDEILAAMQSYKALGITFLIFVPILILTFFTFTVASKVNPFGIIVQRIAWLIYSVYLFIKTGALLILRYVSIGDSASNAPWLDTFFEFFLGEKYTALMDPAAGGNTLILSILFIVAIAVFFIFVVGNKRVTEWFIAERRGADVSKFQDTAERAKQVEEARAAATR